MNNCNNIGSDLCRYLGVPRNEERAKAEIFLFTSESVGEGHPGKRYP